MATQEKKEIALIQNAIDHTQEKIKTWYEQVKTDYNVIGSGTAHYNKSKNEVVVEHIEDGIQKTWSMAFYPEYLENGIDWIFNCWSELV